MHFHRKRGVVLKLVLVRTGACERLGRGVKGQGSEVTPRQWGIRKSSSSEVL